jgi:Methyltransferase domain
MESLSSGDNVSEIIDVDGVTFHLWPRYRPPETPLGIILRKPDYYVEIYRALDEEFRGCRMVEVGVYKGGGTAFFTKLFEPAALIGIDLGRRRAPILMQFLEEHDPGQTVSIHWGVDQSDAEAVTDIVEEVLAGEALDLVVDDASHLPGPTCSTFETLFPRLRPGGLYVIEDWSSPHEIERRIADDLTGRFESGGESVVQGEAGRLDEMPMSYFIAQLVIAAGRKPEWVSQVTVSQGMCLVRRGEAEIAQGTSFAQYLGDLGSRMFLQDA